MERVLQVPASLAMFSALRRNLRDVHASLGQPTIKEVAHLIIRQASLGVKFDASPR